MKITFRNGFGDRYGNFLDLDELNILKITFRNGLKKILQENLAGNSCGKSCGKILRKILAEFLRENLVGNGGGEKANLRKAVIGGNLAFGIG